MVRQLPTKLIASLVFFFCIFLTSFAHAQATPSTTTTNSRCAAFNRNWQCIDFVSEKPITICVEIVTNGAITSQSDRSFANQAAFTAFQSTAPAGTQYLQCGTTPACTQTTETQTLTCPSGQTGQITQTRTVNVGGVCGTNSAWSETANTCTAIPQNTCTTPWGAILQPGQSVTAYSTSTTAYGTVCVSETRTCQTNGTLSGSFTFQTCTVNPPQTCTTPWGATIANGASVTAYKTLTTAYGTVCTSETRTCTNGVLSGSFTFQTCTVNPPQTCTLPWGGTLADGQSVTAYKEATTAYGTVCTSETRTCSNGVLSGTFANQTCTVNPPQTCTTPWGTVIANGASVTAYSTSSTAYGTVCTSETRTCSNGVLSGSYTFQTCTVNPPRVCTTPWGQQLNSGQSVTAYLNPTAQYNQQCVSEVRVCTDGSLSGSYTYQSCTVNPPPANCTLPWGGTLQSGQSVTAYKTTSTAYGTTCSSETRVCTNGTLSGSYTFQTCTVNPPATCTLPWGGTIASGQSVTAYSVTGSGASQQCVNETRVCTNGTLSGSYQLQSCPVTPQCTETTETRTSTPCPSGQSGVITEHRTLNVGQVCGTNSDWSVVSNTCTGNTCALPWGGTLASGQSVTAYSTQTMAYGQTCVSQTRTCTNGVLSGSYTFQNCTVSPPQDCTTPWGATVANGASVTAYSTSSVGYSQQCLSQTRTCTNGVLSGSYSYQTCAVATASCDIQLAAGNYLNLNLLELAQQQACPIVPGVHVTLTILPGATIGSNNVNFSSFTTGTGWPANVVIKVINHGRIEGRGGDGAYVVQDTAVMVPAQAGGPAIDAPYPMTFDDTDGQIWGGGGGGATIGFGHCSPAGGGGAGRVIGNTFDPWGSCDINGNVVAANNNSGRVTRNGKNTGFLATDVAGADNEYMIQSIGNDVNAAYYVSGPGGAPGQAGGNANFYIRSSHGQPYGSPASTILGYYFYPTFPSSVTNVTGGDAGMAIVNPGNVTLTGGNGDRRGKDYPTVPPRAPTPQPPLEQSCDESTDTQTLACPSGQTGIHTQSRTLNVGGVCGVTSDWTDTSNTCQAPQTCVTPWGTTLQSGQSVTAYQSTTTAYGSVCQWETRTCTNGVLSGSYTAQNCTVSPPQNCTTPWGTSLQSGQSVTAYQSTSATYGNSCVSEVRTCTNGALSGSYTKQTCTVNPPASCTTPWGTSLQSGQSVTAYQSTSAAYGSSCAGETRICTNGVLSGSYANQNCTVTPPQNCTTPWGTTISNGQSVTAYASAGPAEGTACVAETRTCSNGTLFGSFASATCTQTMCTIAQAGDAIAKACTTSTYSNGMTTGTNTTTTPVSNGNATATSTSDAGAASAAASGNGSSSGSAAGAAGASGSATATGGSASTSSSSSAASSSSSTTTDTGSSSASSSSASNSSSASATGSGSGTGSTDWMSGFLNSIFKQ